MAVEPAPKAKPAAPTNAQMLAKFEANAKKDAHKKYGLYVKEKTANEHIATEKKKAKV